jgi:NAD+ kinase
VLAGDHGIEERMMVSVAVEAAGDVGRLPPAALNEAVVEKTPMGHTVRLGVYFDGDFWTTYAADGLIVASPTGSTAYSFSARGPIVDPSHRALVLTPVSPHMLFDRSMVLDPSTTVRLEVLGDRPATLSVDGRNVGSLHEGDAVICTESPISARLVSFGGRDFHQILKSKFGLSDR